MWKLLCIASCIFSGYAVIAHFNEHPIFGIMYVFIFLDLGLAYLLVYDKAFRVPALLGRVKVLLGACAVRYRNKRQRNAHEPGQFHPPSGDQSWGFSYNGTDLDSRVFALRSDQCCEHACCFSVGKTLFSCGVVF